MPKNYHLFLKGYVGDWNFSPDMVEVVLDRRKNEEVHVLIDSLGGYLHSALSISSLFKIHGNVHCHYVGANASAATIAAMGAKRVTIDKDALFLVHKCLTMIFEWDYMNADDLAAHIEKLEKEKKDNETFDACIAGMYASRCKKPKEDLLALMKEGAWLTAQEALEWGFVDEITNLDEDAAPVMNDTIASALATAGIPMPPVGPKKGSFLEKLFQFFNPKAEPGAPVEAEITTTTPMSKTFAKICGLLGCTLAITENNLNLTEAQADTIEAAFASKDEKIASLESKLTETIAEKDGRIAELEARVAELEKEPGASTSDVVNTGDENPVASLNVDKVCEALIENLA